MHGEVDAPFKLDFAGMLAMPQVDQTCDVHCVTKWTVLDARFTGVRVADLAAAAKVKPSAHHVVFEAAGGYTSNVSLREALAPNVLVAHRLDGTPLARASRRARACARARSLLLEEREVAHGDSLRLGRRAGILGDARLPQPRRSLARGALQLTGMGRTA